MTSHFARCDTDIVLSVLVPTLVSLFSFLQPSRPVVVKVVVCRAGFIASLISVLENHEWHEAASFLRKEGVIALVDRCTFGVNLGNGTVEQHMRNKYRKCSGDLSLVSLARRL